MSIKERLEEDGLKLLRRGDRFVEREQDTEALSEYVMGFNKLCMSWATIESYIKSKYPGEAIVNLWFSVTQILKKIMVCYDVGDEGAYKRAFLLQNVLDIIDGVKPYEDEMSVEQLDFYEKLKEDMDVYKKLLGCIVSRMIS